MEIKKFVGKKKARNLSFMSINIGELTAYN